MNTRKALSGVALISLVLLIVFISSKSSSIAYFYISWKLCHEDPLLKAVPHPLPTMSLSTAPSSHLTYYNVRFSAPWSRVTDVKPGTQIVRVQFECGQFIAFFNPEKHLNPLKLSGDLAIANGSDIRKIYGRDATQSHFAFLRAILNLTPSQITIFSGWNRLVRDGVFIQIKHIEVRGAETGLYEFHMGGLHGFQKGDPQKSNIVFIDAFDDSDREYELWIGSTKGTPGLVTQEDINTILSTLQAKPVTHSDDGQEPYV